MNRPAAALLAALALAGGTMTAGAAFACSTVPEYVRPTNFELVQLADAIVVARAVTAIEPADDFQVKFEVRQVLKGEAPEAFTGFGVLGPVPPGDPASLSEPHPEAYMGLCVRSRFRAGHDYVIFLERNEDGELRPAGYPFARVNEDFAGENSLWVRTIRRYLAIQAESDPMVELEVLASLRDSLGQGAEDRALAADISDHLASRSPYKPTAYLIDTLNRLRNGEPLADAVRSPAADREVSVAQDLTDAIFGGRSDEFGSEGQIEFILRALITGEHPGAAPVFEALVSNPARTPSELGLAIRFFARNGQYRRAYELIETDAVRILGALPPEARDELLGAVLEAQRGDSFTEGRERWRTDPYVATAWPELALSLYWFMEAVESDGYSASAWGGALEAVPLEDFRARPMATLARPFDEAALAWAGAELASPAIADDEDQDGHGERDRLPLALLVRSYGEDRDAALDSAFCAGGVRRLALFEMVGEWGGSLDFDLLSKYAAEPGLTEEDRNALIDAAAAMHTRERGSRLWARSQGWFTPTGDDTREILRELARGPETGEARSGGVC